MDFKYFEKMFYYDGDDLGVTYSKEATTFKVWAPVCKNVQLILGDNIYPMKHGAKGVWSKTVEGNFHGEFYNYEVTTDKGVFEVVDPYANALTVNGKKGAVVDFNQVNPDNWDPMNKPPLKSLNDVIIYELHMRDISIHPDSGIKHKGKYLGLAEKNTKTTNGLSTGLSHIKELGVTHIQLMPIYDFATVDEHKNVGYNWGYDPLNFNALDGSYSTDPYDPTARIYEFKKMIQAIHDEGIRVIMDVVYNHVYDIHTINFEKLVPDYFFRKKENGDPYNGSGCGNEMASEREMVRKFIVDSVVFWAKEYNLDGFRFDLMGLLDIKTMNEIRRQLDKIDESIIIIGEGWDMGQALNPTKKANYWNCYRMPRVGFFNDAFRDGIKGNVFDESNTGYVSGNLGKRCDVLRGVVGGVDYNDKINHWGNAKPVQTVNYVEVHDNHTLYDKLYLSLNDKGESNIYKRHRLATSILLLSQGIPFIHSGQEFMRSKDFEHNTYNLGDDINQLDWKQKEKYLELNNYVKKLISLRKAHPAFRLKKIDDVRKKLNMLHTSKSIIAYTLEEPADEWAKILVIHNVDTEALRVDLAESGWYVALRDGTFKETGEEVLEESFVELDPLSSFIAFKIKE